MRIFLLALCLGVVACARASEPTPKLPFALRAIGMTVWEAVPDPNAKNLIPTNVGVVAGDDGLLIVDGLASVDAKGNFSAEPSEQLVVEARRITHQPVKFVVNTHHHMDHVDGNAAFAQAGATLVANRRVRDWLKSESLRPFAGNATASQQSFIEAMAPPAVTYDRGIDLFLGRREVHVRSMAGHSGSDSVVIVPDANVVFAGDLLWPHMLPTLVDASTDVWIDSLDALVKANPDATFVPGHGEIAKTRDVVEFRDYLATLRQLVAAAQQEGKSATDVVAAVMPSLSEKYGRWQLFTAVAKENILEVDAELRGIKRIPR